ncbi:hypothetical protein SAMN05216167_101741 [Spirosoma endophyticum]|uniref:Uncharacterized protein n=1 Tax=Spirosoma endophyticum TaxID=662367 RepID=A0A1I1HMY7_9BACT|nr:hypothetical protein SAMN05216167_101741 [Spirosoma endophyticum]
MTNPFQRIQSLALLIADLFIVLPAIVRLPDQDFPVS